MGSVALRQLAGTIRKCGINDLIPKRDISGARAAEIFDNTTIAQAKSFYSVAQKQSDLLESRVQALEVAHSRAHQLVSSLQKYSQNLESQIPHPELATPEAVAFAEAQ